MVVLRLHYMSDVVAGVPLGLAVTGCTALALDAIAGHWSSPDAASGRSNNSGTAGRPSRQELGALPPGEDISLGSSQLHRRLSPRLVPLPKLLGAVLRSKFPS